MQNKNDKHPILYWNVTNHASVYLYYVQYILEWKLSC